jgi:two-component system chemotaxis response regulator CheY
MGLQNRWFGKNRRSGNDRRKINDPNYTGPEQRKEPDRRSRAPRSLLIVDSSATSLFYIGMLLKKLDYDIRTAMTAEDALQALAAAPPDLVVTESLLPRMNGINLLRQMKQDHRFKTIPVIFYTADNDPDLRTACKIAGCADFLKKPVEPDALYRSIQAATETTPRQTIRIDTSLRVEIGDTARHGEAIWAETVTTISSGGVHIKTPTPEPVDTILPLKIFLRNREVNVRAVVLQSSPAAEGARKESGMAMKFISISPEDKTHVQDFIMEQLTRDIAIPKR